MGSPQQRCPSISFSRYRSYSRACRGVVQACDELTIACNKTSRCNPCTQGSTTRIRHNTGEGKKMRAPGTKLGARISLATRQHRKDRGIHGSTPPLFQITRLRHIPKEVKPMACPIRIHTLSRRIRGSVRGRYCSDVKTNLRQAIVGIDFNHIEVDINNSESIPFHLRTTLSDCGACLPPYSHALRPMSLLCDIASSQSRAQPSTQQNF